MKNPIPTYAEATDYQYLTKIEPKLMSYSGYHSTSQQDLISAANFANSKESLQVNI